MKVDDARKLFGDKIEVTAQETILAMTLGVSISHLLSKYNPALQGAALGIALGRYVRGVTNEAADQERVMDRVLIIAAHQANHDDAP